ncbi:zinc transporter ZIP3-like [Sitophilus oryzae]|uniref:Zinc transporter ZIP3-like n=1 Tax=Sitophilus oryzae TaxID=7048 RepID=A0A6J2YAE2_SITOR|nr:zinc transporter ZIP3-like [Sitophilus oryzae]
MDLVSTKVLVAIIFGIFRFFFGMLPVKLDTCLRRWEEGSTDKKTFINAKRHQQVTCAVAMTQSFGGGVMFATCFLHMMRTLFVSVEELKKIKGITNEYPISQLMISLGFFSIYFLEEFSHWMINSNKSCTKSALDKVATSLHKESSRSSNKITPVRTIETIEEWDLNEKNRQFDSNFENEVDFLESPSKTAPKAESSVTFSPTKSEKAICRSASAKSRYSIREDLERANNAVIEEEDEEKLKDREQVMRCVLTIAALSLHSILEGLSIGIQKQTSEIWYLFIAVSIHSASILFVMGVELILAQTKMRFIVIQMIALAVASPLGIFLGLLVTVDATLNFSTMATITVFLEGLSAGTILYITFFEVLNREKERRVYRLRRCLCIMGGFTLMAFLQYAESRSAVHADDDVSVLTGVNVTNT